MANRFLDRQIRKYLGDPDQLPENYQTLFKVVGDLLEHYEKDRNMLERSIELSSQEMIELNTKLRNETAELKKAHHELKTLFENIDNVVFSVDMTTHQTLQMSPACLKTYGYPPEDFYLNPNLWYELIVEEDKRGVQKNYPIMRDGKSFTQEYRIICKDGIIKWLESKITPTLDAEGNLVRIDGISTDISARKEAEQKIVYSESRFRHLIEKSHDGIALLGSDGKLIYVTPSVKRIMGYESHELVGIDPSELTHPDDREKAVALLQALIPRFGETVHAEYRMLNKDGNWRWMSANITNLLREPSIGAIVFNYEDISETVLVETQLEFDRKNRDALINSTSDLMWSFDSNMCLVTANDSFLQAVEALSGVALKQGDCLVTIKNFPKTEHQKWINVYKRVLNGETFKFEDYRKYPYELWYEVSLHPIFENNVVIGASCFSRDTTEQKESLRLLRKSEKMMAEAERIAHLGSWELELESGEKKVQWSDEVYRIFGRKKGKYVPNYDDFLRSVHAKDRARVEEALQKVFSGNGRYDIEFCVVLPEGNERWIRASGDLVHNRKTGKPAKLIGTVQDITERKHIEEERTKITNDLIQRNKDLEQFTYIVSHNLRAPVVNIQGLVNIVQHHKLDKESYTTCLDGLHLAAKRLDEIIIDLNNILQVRNAITEKKENVDFSAIINNITDTVQPLIDQGNVVLKTDFDEVGSLYSVKSYLYSIFYNLISNSIKYRQPDVPPVVEIKSVKQQNGTILIFKDNCRGIDLSLHGEKVFGLYKRFHLNIEGKGVGLFMVKTQVEALGGTVSIKSEVNRGTEFTLMFNA